MVILSLLSSVAMMAMRVSDAVTGATGPVRVAYEIGLNVPEFERGACLAHPASVPNSPVELRDQFYKTTRLENH